MLIRPHRRRFALLVLTLVASFAFLAAACGGSSSSATPTTAGSTVSLKGAVISPPPVKPDVTLTDTSGQPYNIVQNTRGYLTLFYMGYTHCPDACPQAMAQLASVVGGLPPAISSKVKVIFVTTDPKRDTPQVLRTWLDQFSPSFIGLTGSEAQIVALEQQEGIPVAQIGTPDASGNYAVNHATFVLAFTAQDNIAHTAYPGGFSNADIASDITTLVTKGWKG